MASTSAQFPPIPGSKLTNRDSPLMVTRNEYTPSPSHSSKPTATGGSASSYKRHGGVRLQGRKDRENYMKKQLLRFQQPTLSKFDTTRYRNTYKHTLCLEMLQAGYHRSYTELFALIKHQSDERLKAGPDSSLWSKTLLENEHEKLDTLKFFLTHCEAAKRKSREDEVYKGQYELAKYFEKTGDHWLVEYFFGRCLETSKRIGTDSRRKEAEANSNLGSIHLIRGNLPGATEYFEEFYKLVVRKPWRDETGCLLYATACDKLYDLYSKLASDFEETDPKTSISYLLKSFDRAKEGGDRKKEAHAMYMLGRSYISMDDTETALIYNTGYMDLCKELGDQEGMGYSCEAISKCYERTNRFEEAIQYLESFVDIAEKTGLMSAYCRACMCLGTMYNNLGLYDMSARFFGKAYRASIKTASAADQEMCRVRFGIANAHRLLNTFTPIIQQPQRTNLESLISWKDVRNEPQDD